MLFACLSCCMCLYCVLVCVACCVCLFVFVFVSLFKAPGRTSACAHPRSSARP